jgi:hypothetical protein
MSTQCVTIYFNFFLLQIANQSSGVSLYVDSARLSETPGQVSQRGMIEIPNISVFLILGPNKQSTFKLHVGLIIKKKTRTKKSHACALNFKPQMHKPWRNQE